ITEKLVNLQNENARLSERIMTLEKDGERQSSVSAHVRLSKTTPISGTERVMYDLEISNIGGAYDFQNGQFIAPVAGVYMFRVTLCLFANKQWMDLNIVKNDHVIGRVFSVDNQYHTCGSEALSIHFDAGDKIWVQRAAGTSLSLNQDHGWNSFTAILIHAD
ncbi:complement C1q-like protein 4, partial [Mercenaria mercenaria]|uniref:complement C1q-like protein 4 n=1 Tax=Mercenaria mercenaria TaxID=6596 RepID=UPI00234F7ED3